MRQFGAGWLAFRAWYALQMKAGLIGLRTPAGQWAGQPLPHIVDNEALHDPEHYLEYRRGRALRFFFSALDRDSWTAYFTKWDCDADGPVQQAEELLQGTLRYFAHRRVHAGFPPAWFRNPFSGESVPNECHWSEVDEFAHGDIRVIWEPNRFGFAYPLVRAYYRTGDERYAEAFWQLVEDWRLHNPPQWGPNWRCGQEVALRAMAWCFGLYGFLHSPSTTPLRAAALAEMIAVSGHRIESNIAYALSQRNNHGISEGTGLWTIGMLFPEFRTAARWREVGQRVLEAQGRELIYDDGSFVQHSVVYHRLMLQTYLWCIRHGDLQDQPFSAELKARVAKAGAWLYQIQDDTSGRVPYYGQNDGSLILPLCNCDYQDFRPVIQAIHYLSTGTRCYGDGPWDEGLLWLFGPTALGAPVVAPERRDFRAAAGGYYTLRSATGFAFTRCATYQHRPGQADMLHVDLWWRGQNVVIDPGTFSYNAPAPWNNPLAQTAYHNTVTVDEFDQMDRVGKFLWLPWQHGWVHHDLRSAGDHLAYWEGENDGYRRLRSPVRHRRAIVRLGTEHWLVLDRLESEKPHSYRLHWLLIDVPYVWDGTLLTLETPAGQYQVRMAPFSGKGEYSLAHGEPDSPRGWRAPYYTYREPAISFAVAENSTATYFYTLLCPNSSSVHATNSLLDIRTPEWQAFIELGSGIDQSIATFIRIAGSATDEIIVPTSIAGCSSQPKGQQ